MKHLQATDDGDRDYTERAIDHDSLPPIPTHTSSPPIIVILPQQLLLLHPELPAGRPSLVRAGAK